MDVILFLAFVLFIYSAVKKNQKNMKEALKKKEQAMVDAQINQTRPQQASGAAGNRNAASPFSLPRPSNALRQELPKNSAAAAPKPKPAAVQEQEEEQSTTEMLAKKARQDQLEHQKEKAEQAQYEKKYYGNYHYAKRYLLGDPVPATERLVYCPNCAAENLIKITDNPKRFNCYFCREKLG